MWKSIRSLVSNNGNWGEGGLDANISFNAKWLPRDSNPQPEGYWAEF